MARRPAGEYIHPITVNQYAEAADASGQLVPTATPICTRLAAKLIPNGREMTIPDGSQQMGINNVILFVMWDQQTEKITPAMVVMYQGKEFEITAARDVTGRREEIQIDAIERTT